MCLNPRVQRSIREPQNQTSHVRLHRIINREWGHYRKIADRGLHVGSFQSSPERDFTIINRYKVIFLPYLYVLPDEVCVIRQNR